MVSTGRPLTRFTHYSVTYKIDGPGEFMARYPISGEEAGDIVVGRGLDIYHDRDGLIAKGVIEKVVIDPDRLELVATGPTRMIDLVRYSVRTRRVFDGIPFSDAAETLLALAGWTLNSIETATDSTTNSRFDGGTALAAIAKLAHLRQAFVREVPGTMSVDLGEFGEDRGITAFRPALANPQITMSDEVCLLEEIRIDQNVSEVVNWLLPLGKGEGEAKLNLKFQSVMPNLISNPSFEGTLDSWSVTEPSGGSADLANLVHAVDGDWSLFLQGSASGNAQVAQDISGITGNASYRYEAWTWPVAGTIRLAIDWYTAGMSFIGSATADSSGTGAMEKISLADTAPATAGVARLWIQVGNGENGWVDATRFWKAAASVDDADYDVESGLDGNPDDQRLLYYIEDTGSQVAYGMRQYDETFQDIGPLTNSTADVITAASTLYRAASSLLNKHKDRHDVYHIRCRGNALANLLVGDRMRVVFKGEARSIAGTEWVFVDLDDLLYVTEIRREYDDDDETWTLAVSDTIRDSRGDVGTLGQLVDLARALRVNIELYPSLWQNTIVREIDSTHTFSFVLDFAESSGVIAVPQAKLVVTRRALRATATGSASGGGGTSSSETDHTHSVTISAHTHTVSIGSHSHGLSGTTTDSGGGATSTSDGAHRHEMGRVFSATPETWADPGYAEIIRFYSSSGTELWQLVIGSVSSRSWSTDQSFYTREQAAAHEHDTPDHTHSFSSQTTQSGGSSTPTSSSGGSSAPTSEGGGAHSHTVSAHTHTLSYGIFEDSDRPTAINITINGTNRTTVLGGPWSADFEVDIWPFLSEQDGRALQQEHTITFSCTSKGALEVSQVMRVISRTVLVA